MEKGRGKGTDTLQTDNVFTRKEYIEREAANDWFMDMFYSPDDEGCKELVERFNKAIPAADVVPVNWISTTERLPEDGDNVIVCTKSGNVGEAKYQAALGYDLNYPEIWFLLNDYGNQYQTGEIIAWMPLPEPPKEET